MPIRPFRWLPHNHKRHAVDADLVPRDETRTLCGEELVIPTTPCTKDQWCWPTCTECDARWRTAEGILPFPRRSTPTPHPRRPVPTTAKAHAR
ncbi:zinc finger protein [Saccharothrix carnea]|uniref:Zinc finger protein n=1 Tax=Saccharothrix carnea TaxID=1280637 RepID=A0A2P8HYV4_SACCR|nr:zinc finger protein [Saccharothrix carnea]PSL51411.1 zinc finger protein [Saccharothrix carnea]